MSEGQVQIRGFVMGVDTPWMIEGVGVVGLGVGEALTSDQERGDRDGDVGGADVLRRRLIPITLAGTFDSEAEAWESFQVEAKPAWGPSKIDIELGVQLVGMPTALTFFGRPRGFDADLSMLAAGLITAQANFEALDPFGYDAEEELSPGTSFTVSNATAVSDRATITIVGNGGTPRIENVDDQGGAISWAGPLVNLAERVINLRDHTVVDGSGNDRYGEIATSSRWFVFQPGDNDIAVTGATSAQVTFRPANL